MQNVSVILYKRMGLPNSDIAFYTGWFYLPWVIKPLWSPVVDLLKTKRWWIVVMQAVIAVGLGLVALTIPAPHFVQYSIAFFWLIAFSSATHDIAADGFYMLGLDSAGQSFFSGIRSTFYRIAMISAEGLLVIIAGELEFNKIGGVGGSIPFAWMAAIGIMAILFGFFCIYHVLILPRTEEAVAAVAPEDRNSFLKEFITTFTSFFKKDHIGAILFFLLIYRFGEAQLLKLASPFFLDARSVGGLALSTQQVGFLKGTVGTLAMVLGGVLGGIVATKRGLGYWLWPMVLAIHLPDAMYVYLSYAQPENFFVVNICVAIEQFGYGFGFTAYVLFMLYVSQGKHSTAHFALCTGFMAMGMMVPGMFSGAIQNFFGYQHFFVWVMVATIPGFIATRLVTIDPEFGKKKP